MHMDMFNLLIYSTYGTNFVILISFHLGCHINGNVAVESNGSASSVDSLSIEDSKSSKGHDDIFNLLRNIPGNDSCA